MNRSMLTMLLVFISGLVYGTGASSAEPSSSEKRDELFVQTISKHLDLPTGQVLEESFWTRTELVTKENTQLYYCDPFAPDSAKTVAEQLKQVYDAWKANDDIESAADGIRALAYVPNGNDFKRSPIKETILYKELREQYSATDIAAQSWVQLVRHWHEQVVTEHKEDYLPALNEAIQTIPKLAEAIIDSHQAIRGESNSAAPAGPDAATANSNELDEQLLKERLSTDVQKLREKQEGPNFIAMCKAVIDATKIARDNANSTNDEPESVRELFSETDDAIKTAIEDAATELGEDPEGEIDPRTNESKPHPWVEAHDNLWVELDGGLAGFNKERVQDWVFLHETRLQILESASNDDDAPDGDNKDESETNDGDDAETKRELSDLQKAIKAHEDSAASFNERLTGAADLMKKIESIPPTGSVIVDVDYFRSQLDKEWADAVVPLKEGLKSVPLVATALFEAMNNAASAHDDGTDTDRVVATWREEQAKLLDKLTGSDPGDLGEPDEVGLAFDAFLNAWREKVLEKESDRFQDALRQASIIIVGVLREIEDQSIKDIMNGTVTNGGGSNAGGRSDGTVGRGIHAVWHERRKAAIKRRIARIRARYE